MDIISSWVSPMDIAILLRLLAATFLGALIGFERERSGKVAGLRTHALVSLGAALFSVISVLMFTRFPSVNGVAGYDYHLIANIIVGIGFIGAGTVLRQGDKIRGITTAASLWVVAAIGMASGLGFFKEAFATTVLVYVILVVLWFVERKFGSKILYTNLRGQENDTNSVE